MNSIDLQKIRDYFFAQPIRRAYLFGSHARGDAGSKSDVDILVELDYSQPIGLRFVQMQLDLESLLQTKVDLLSDKAVSKYMRQHVDKDKKLIYEKESW